MISISHPFNLESILSSLEQEDYRIVIKYNDDSYREGFISQEYDKQQRLRYIIFEPPLNPKDKTSYHIIDINSLVGIGIKC